jgi:DNA-directed RNA polymerase subunit RPC12/RpoP
MHMDTQHQRNWKLRQYAEYVCVYCGSKKDPLSPLATCPNCGAPLTKVELHDVRRTFTQSREAPPQ